VPDEELELCNSLVDIEVSHLESSEGDRAKHHSQCCVPVASNFHQCGANGAPLKSGKFGKGVVRDIKGVGHHGDKDDKGGCPGVIFIKCAAEELTSEGGCLGGDLGEGSFHLTVGSQPASKSAMSLIGVVLCDWLGSVGGP
jgi:hypothetical protein